MSADRSSLDFDYGGKPHPEAKGAKSGSNSWEPPDEVKGDVARMMPCMDVRYAGGSGVPDLVLVDQATRSGTPKFGHLCELLEWHALDEVSDWERRRNDRVVEKQGKGNPFVDHPEYAGRIWSGGCERT